jgi:hypothetical protein
MFKAREVLVKLVSVYFCAAAVLGPKFINWKAFYGLNMGDTDNSLGGACAIN